MSLFGDQFRIEARPQMHTVEVGTEVTYELVEVPIETTGTLVLEGPHVKDMRASISWLITNDVNKALPTLKMGPTGGKERWKVKWSTPGHHVVYCNIDGEEASFKYEQRVETSVAVIQRRTLKRYRGKVLQNPNNMLTAFAGGAETLPNPGVELFEAKRYLATLEAAEQYISIPKDKIKSHKDRVKQLKTYINSLEKTIGADYFTRYEDPSLYSPFYAIHLARGKNTAKRKDLQSKLRVCLRLLQGKTGYEVDLIDWTNPLPNSNMPKTLAGSYRGEGKTGDEAISNAIESWRKRNAYFPGHIDCYIPRSLWHRYREPGFDTPRSDDLWSHLPAVSEWLDWISTGLFILAVVVAFLVPGGQIVGGLILTAILTSTSAAVINIGRRHADGFADASMADAFDMLTIMGNIFLAGQGGMVRSAVITRGTQKFIVYGDIAVTGVEGLLIGATYYDEFEKILNDPSLTPSERIEKLGMWGAKALAVGSLSYVNVKSSAMDIKGLKGGVDQKQLDKFRNPNEEISLDQNPKIKTDSSDGQITVTVRQDPERLGRSKARVGTDVNRPSLAPSKRGMRNRDDAAFASMAEKGDIIIVRDSNPAALDYIGTDGYKPKPLELKAKTRQDPPNQGLAAADPKDPRLIEALKEEGIDYPTYVKKLEAEGFHVGGAKDGHLISDGAGNKFYSDYDLHGIYNGKTGKNSYSEAKRNALNKKFGGDLIQHGPHDRWPDRNNRDIAGINHGPQPPCTAYMPPNGKAYELRTIDDMKAFYKAQNIDWDDIYPNH